MMRLIIINSNTTSSYFKEFNEIFPQYNIDYIVISGKEALYNYQIQKNDIFLIRKVELSDFERISLASKLQENKVINLINLTVPRIKEKSYQQLIIKRQFRKYSIPTYLFKNKSQFEKILEISQLEFPLIIKPNIGTQGKGIVCLSSISEIKRLPDFKGKEYVIQPFISNDGDYRIRVIGGLVAGMVKRVAHEKDFRNNISQGGSINEVESIYRSILSKIATRLTCFLGLDFAGIDIIRDKNTGEFFIMEINSVPARTSLPIIMGDNYYPISKYLAQNIVSSNNHSIYKKVEEYYTSNFKFLEEYQFHYTSRLYLWKQEEKYKKLSEISAKKYLGGTSKDKIIDKIKLLINNIGMSKIKKSNNLKRNIQFEKYPDIIDYNIIFFKLLFAKTIFQINIVGDIKALINREHLNNIINTLSKDKEAISYLSTHAINLFYHIENLFGRQVIHPQYFLDIMKDFDLLDTKAKISCIYLGTHCIIGASNFYSKNIIENREIYDQMLKLIEKIIEDDYFNINLDAKCEFLVCCRIMNYRSILENIIYSETNNSLSSIGDFIVDTHNKWSSKRHNIDFIRSEHRNVLFVLSHTFYKPKF